MGSRRIYDVITARSSFQRNFRNGAKGTRYVSYTRSQDVRRRIATLKGSTELIEGRYLTPISSGRLEKCERWLTNGCITTITKGLMKHWETYLRWNTETRKKKKMIDAQIGKSSSAYELCKTRTSALRAVLHTTPAYAYGGLSEINQKLQLNTKTKKILNNQSNWRLS